MKNRIFFSIWLLSGISYAIKFEGYDPGRNPKPLILNECILKYKEGPKDFYIVFSNHDGVYSFPRSKKTDNQVRDFLTNSINLKKKVVATVDLGTAKIFYLHDYK